MKNKNTIFFNRLITLILLFIVLISMLAVPSSPALAASTNFDDIPGAGIAILDPAAGFSCTATVTRIINIASSFQVGDINVGLNISHLRRSDIRVTLTSPAGTVVTLISGAGLGSPTIASPDDFDDYDILLDDTSTGSLYDNDNDNVAVPLYDRTARPNNALSKFKGENASGNWTLTICDTSNGTAGTYNQARLIITSADPNTIAGTVFTDYNDNGVRGQGDLGVGTVTVSAYDAAGVLVDSDITSATGAYSLTIPNGTAVRLEFSTIPANLRPGAFGVDSGTTVQFVTSPAIAVDLGLSQPEDYCNNNPLLVMPCYVNGNPLGGGSAGTRDVLVSIPYDAYGRQDNTIEQPLATGAQIGATWGLAFQRATGTVYAGAIAKRHVGLGPLGSGGIYAVEINPLTGASISVNNFVDIATLGIPVGTLGTNAARGLPNVAATPSTDPTGWDAVGKSAIGDMDMGSNDDTLWLINLANQTLYSIYIGNPPVAPTIADVSPYPIALPAGATACAAGDIRPWAVEVYRGDVYVGVVCSAESTQNVNDLRGYIIRMDEAAPAGFSLTFEFALNYPRGVVSASDGGFPAEWRPWSPTMTSLCTNPCASAADLAYDKQIIYPQPILSDIEFDTNGDMVLGLMDRAGQQVGNANYATTSPWGTVTLYNKDTGYTATSVTIPAVRTYEGTVAGDLLRVCRVAGVFTLENNATCGSITTGGTSSVPGQGPGNGEYYWQDMYNASTNKNGGTHHEVTLGGLVLFPGTDEIAVSMFDPFNVRSGGLVWFSNTTGLRTRAYEVFGVDEGGGAATFGKAAGIGDVEGFCYNAPIEIGNRIWNDSDGDGVQDPGELPIAGVTVELYQGATLISTAVTDVNGNYFFSSGPGTSTANHKYFLDGLNPNENYEIRIPNATGGSQQAALSGLTLTLIDTDQDQRDSDGAYSATNAIITLTTGNAGDNNHTYDFGFTGAYSLGNRVWFDNGVGGGIADNGIQDGTEAGIDGVVINLYADTNDDGTPDGAILATLTTAGGGYYRFDGLSAGNYIVEVAASNFIGVGALVGKGTSSSVDEADPDSDVDLNDNGIGIFPDPVNGIRSATVTLGPGTAEPTNDNDPAPNPALTLEAANDHSNRTVDFGFVESYSLGNRVWFDTDNSGTINGAEIGISGVRVELYLDNGDGVYGAGDTFQSFATTDVSGYYRFDNLAAGEYVVVLPADNFRDVGVGDTVVGDPLSGYLSSGTSIAANGTVTDSVGPDVDTIATDSDDNGVTSFTSNTVNYVSSQAVTLGAGASEPTGETDKSGVAGEAPDGQSNMTVDFGFYRQELGNLVYIDVNNNGSYAVGDTLLAGATVRLYAGNGTTEIITGADGVIGTADDGYGPDGISGNGDDGTGGVITGVGGTYQFSGLPAGDYIVKVTPPAGYASTVDTANNGDTTNPNNNIDSNDNGVGVSIGQVASNVVTLTPGSAGAASNNTVTNSSGTTANPTVDFGFVVSSGLSKTIIGTDQTFTTGNNVAIGEIVTYEVVINLPVGVALNSVTITDRLDKGLAYVDCLSVNVAGVDVTNPVCTSAVVSSITNPGDSAANPGNPGRQVVFTIGNVPAPAAVSTIVVQYRAIVLDIIENQQTRTLGNNVTWAWTGGSFSTRAPNVTIVEPDISIDKSATPTIVTTGATVQFTLVITHTAPSTADAFDVVVTDILPAGLDYIPCTPITYSGLVPTTQPNTCALPNGNELVFVWDSFPLNQSATIVFFARFNGTQPSLVNLASVAWTSLPIDPGGIPPQSIQLSTHNTFSTERDYDPGDSINIYRVFDSVRINPPAAPVDDVDLPNQLPATGFEPDVITTLPEQSVGKSYAATDVWMEIPSLGVNIPIVGVPLVDGDWDLTWLGKQAGWLNGTAFPGWEGNSALTGHVYLPNGKPGPFVGLGSLKWGSKIIVHAYGSVYTYEVRENNTIAPENTSALKHEETAWLTLITCKSYNQTTDTYASRIAVRAALVSVQKDRSETIPRNGR